MPLDYDPNTGLIRNPPELDQYASRGDPSMDRWPGRKVDDHDIMKAAGDPRDWFQYGHRQLAADKLWDEFWDARERRQKFSSGFSWNQVLIIGDYGSGKTTLGIYHALKAFRFGHPVFSNASCLFGWHLEHEEMYTAMGFMPANSVLLIDEGSAALASRVQHGVAVSSFQEMNLNSRKRSCQVLYMTAQDWELAASIRRNCQEVWMPVKPEDLTIERAKADEPLAPAEDPSNFILAWHVWDDFPYRKGNLIEGADKANEGFGPPAYTLFAADTNLVRWAFLLNDTFELAQAGAATTADRDVVKDQLGDFLDGRGPGPRANGSAKTQAHSDKARVLIAWLLDHDNPPEYFSVGEIGSVIGLEPAATGIFLQQAFPGLQMTRRRGYPSAFMFNCIDKYAAE